VRRLISRTAALALSVTVAFGLAAVPCAAGDTAAARTGGKLTHLSPASRQVLATATPATPKLRSSEGGQAAAPSAPGSFFKSTRGKVTLALMGAGTGLTLWSIQHDRKPVKSPIR
jgi:hypothetical protein